jgi:CBS domain-containing protein
MTESNGRTRTSLAAEPACDDAKMWTHGDPLETALATEPVSAIQHEPFITVAPDMPIHRVLQLLVVRDISCVLVADGLSLVGLFTQRDVLDKVAIEYEAVKDRPVSEIMTKNPIVVYDTDSSAKALCVMATGGYRHVPVLDENENIVGVVSPQRVAAFLERHFS